MKKIICILSLFFCITAEAQEFDYTYNFFTNSTMSGDYFFSHTSNSGNSVIKNSNDKLPVSKLIYHTAGNALQLQYKNAPGGNWKAIIYQDEKRGIDHFKRAKFLSFWVSLIPGQTTAKEFPQVQLMKKDSSLTIPLPVDISATSKWQHILLPMTLLKDFDPKKPTDIIGIVFSQQNNEGKDHVVYVDDIEFMSAQAGENISFTPSIATATGYAMHVDLSWKKIPLNNIHLVKIYRSANGKDFSALGIQQPFVNRYADFTGETGKKYFYKISFLNSNYEETKLSATVSATTRKMSDEELMTMVQEASFRYYWEAAESNSGMAKENIPGRQDMIASGASGFGILALITGTERKFITRKQAIERFIKIVNFLEHAETFHGVYPHFIDGPTGKVNPFFGNRDNGADLVETSFLMQGLLAARQYFSADDSDEKMIREKITSIWEKAEWDWFKQYPNSKLLYWHWSPDQAWTINHNLIGWNETMVTYLLAIASPTHAVPASMYYSGWANQDTTGQQYRSGWSGTGDGSMYTNGKTYHGIKLDVGVSKGGPLFFTHYSYMGYDPHFITDKYTNYFKNNQNIAKINHRYCVENPKHYKGYSDSSWGLTASDGPFDYYPDEPVLWNDHGKITPTGAISSFPYTPVESMKALKKFYFDYGKFTWGPYGFRNAFDLNINWCSENYMGLDQATMVVMMENYRTGFIWKLFMGDPDVKAGLEKLNLETKAARNKTY